MSQPRWAHYIGRSCGCLAVLLVSHAGQAGESSYSLEGTFEQWHYTSSKKQFFRSDQVSSNSSVLGLDFQWSSHPNYVIDLSYLYSAAEQSHNFHPKELYYQTELLKLHTSWGFKKHLWSQADQTWQRGLWQPRFFWDKLLPKQQGMLGLHIAKDVGENHKFYLLVSPLSIPEMGPQFEVNSQGLFDSKSPWFRPPPETTELLSQQITNSYTLEDPDIGNFISNPALATQWLSQLDSLDIRFSYAYKPMNQILMASYTILDLPSNRMSATTEPQIRYHHLGTLEVGSSEPGSWHTWASITSDDPLPNDHPDTWIAQTVEKALVWTAYAGYDLQGKGDEASHVFFTYTYVDGGDARDKGEFAQDISYYENRFQYTKALRIGYRGPIHWGLDGSLNSTTTLTYDKDQNGMTLHTEWDWQWNQQWKLTFQADVLGIVNEGKADKNGGVIRDYRANDRVSLGVTYEF